MVLNQRPSQPELLSMLQNKLFSKVVNLAVMLSLPKGDFLVVGHDLLEPETIINLDYWSDSRATFHNRHEVWFKEGKLRDLRGKTFEVGNKFTRVSCVEAVSRVTCMTNNHLLRGTEGVA